MQKENIVRFIQRQFRMRKQIKKLELKSGKEKIDKKKQKRLEKLELLKKSWGAVNFMFKLRTKGKSMKQELKNLQVRLVKLFLLKKIRERQYKNPQKLQAMVAFCRLRRKGFKKI